VNAAASRFAAQALRGRPTVPIDNDIVVEKSENLAACASQRGFLAKSRPGRGSRAQRIFGRCPASFLV
jgi:hypothetical protein